jgi:ATP-dependent exoDNAse (exonuclease V) alpha subunit
MLSSTAPTTKDGIEKYLGSGMVKGIGPVYAKKLVEKFGEKIFNINEQESARLEDVDGIGPKRRLRIKEAWAEHSRIITNAHRINEGQMPEVPAKDRESDLFFIDRAEPDQIAATLVEMVKTRIPAKFRLDPIRDIQVLCPMNRGSLGIRELNVKLQMELNPARSEEPVVEKFGWQFRVRDKVIQTENGWWLA